MDMLPLWTMIFPLNPKDMVHTGKIFHLKEALIPWLLNLWVVWFKKPWGPAGSQRAERKSLLPCGSQNPTLSAPFDYNSCSLLFSPSFLSMSLESNSFPNDLESSHYLKSLCHTNQTGSTTQGPLSLHMDQAIGEAKRTVFFFKSSIWGSAKNSNLYIQTQESIKNSIKIHLRGDIELWWRIWCRIILCNPTILIPIIITNMCVCVCMCI